MTDLKPCPFCGKAPRRGLKRNSQDMSGMIFCDACEYWRYEEGWQRRAALPPACAVPEEIAKWAASYIENAQSYVLTDNMMLIYNAARFILALAKKPDAS